MPTLNSAMKAIAQLAKEKNRGEDIATKIYYAMIELGEAGDIWKHREDEKYLKGMGLTLEKVPEAVAEELIDTIFYCLHGCHCIGFYDADGLFDYKLIVNKQRSRVYADDHKEAPP